MPHIRLPLLSDQARVVTGRTPPLTARDQRAHGRALLNQLDVAKNQLERLRRERPRGAPPVPEGIQLLVKGAASDTGKVLLEASRLKGLRLEVMEERRDGLFLTVSADPNATKFQETIESFRNNERTPKGRRKKGTRQIFEIDEINANATVAKKGDELALVEIRDGVNYTVDIELAAGREHPAGEQRREEFAEYLTASNGRIVGNGAIIEEDYALYRAYITGGVINDLLSNHPWVVSVDLPPTLERQGFELRDIRLDELPPIGNPPAGAPVVIALDGGIVPQQPLIRSAVAGVQHESFLPSDNSIVDGGTLGHGTATVSLIAHSSLREAILNNVQITPVRAVIARVLDDNSRIPEELRVKEVIPRAVQRMYDIHRATIACHSIASCAPFNRTRMSVWAETLDRLAYDGGGPGFLIVAAAGNIDGQVSPTLVQVQQWLRDPGYPNFLTNERCRLRNPAQAINVLTVGAYVPRAGAPFHARGHGHQFIGQSNAPAPFTRTGFGYLSEVKPEVVEEGGNWYQDGDGRLITGAQVTDVAVADSQFATSGRLIRFEQGTSVAAPRVAHLGARILEVLPTASADLLRALIVNSAIWPSRIGSTEDTLRLFGYGVPSKERALAPGGPRCLLYAVEAIPIGHAQFFRIPFPRDLFDDTPETMLRVSVTLAYRAPVRKTNRRYRGTILEWKFGKRGEPLAQFRQRCSAGHLVETDEGEDEAEEQAIGDWNWTIGSRLRTKGTVQKDWFEAPAADFGEELLLAVIGRRGWLSKERQDAGFDQSYAVSICIEAIGVVVPIHEVIEARVQIPIPAV